MPHRAGLNAVLLATVVNMTETLLSSDLRSPAARTAAPASRARLLEAYDACPTCGSRQRLLTAVLERIPDVVLLLDDAGFVMYANTAARACSIGESENLLVSDLIHDEDRASVRDAWNRLLGLPGQTVSIQARFNRNGEWPRVIVTGENLLDEADAGCILVTATDVLRRR
ncbi:MAG TPA: PAS domain-containing protein, partial [Thermoanaerobaculia bacterium]